jgi:hypothetical protein
MEIKLEQVDQVRDRTGVSYSKAKEALEKANGNVLDAIILIEEENEAFFTDANEGTGDSSSQKSETIEELKSWLKDLINKGNITRIKVRKEEQVIVDIPVNAGIAAGVIAIIIPPILAVILVAAVVTKVTIEITKEDGSIEVVNKYISKAVNDAKDMATDISEKVKEKIVDIKDDINLDGFKNCDTKNKEESQNINTFTYTVNFEDEEDKSK